jgi:hypothetical protein
MHVPINVKSPNNINNWQIGFDSAFKGLRLLSDSAEGGYFQKEGHSNFLLVLIIMKHALKMYGGVNV